MTVQRLCVVHMPSANEFGWRHALTSAALGMGWGAWDYVMGQENPVDLETSVIIHCSDVRDVSALAPTATAILAGSPADSTRVLMARFGIDELEALRSTARVFAFASEMAGRGTPVFSAQADTATFPFLGKVRPDLGPTHAPVLTILGNPLEIYDTIPSPLGARADWIPGLFHWVAGDQPGICDLTGRGRILQHGPYLDLSPGEWTIEVQFAITLDRAKADLRFEWGTGADAQSSNHTFSEAGRYAITLTKEWIEPAAGELRIWLDRAMFDGGLVIENAVVTKTG